MKFVIRLGSIIFILCVLIDNLNSMDKKINKYLIISANFTLIMIVILLAYLIISSGNSPFNSDIAKNYSTIAINNSSVADTYAEISVPWNQSYNSVFDYEPIYYNIMTVKDNIVYLNKGTMLERSTDFGKTYSELLDIGPNYFVNAFITSTGKVIAFSNDSKIYRSNDGVSFSPSDTSEIEPYFPPMYSGIDSYGDTIIFGEYDTKSNTSYRLIRSTDGGLTWQAILSKNSPEEIRHWHNVIYNNYSGNWYTTSGDDREQVGWYESPDNGTSWIQIFQGTANNSSTAQEYRNTKLLLFTSADDVWWGSDTTDKPAIFQGSLTNISSNKSSPVRVFNLTHACWGMAGKPPILIAFTSVESVDNDKYSFIYVSTDNGKTWQIDMEWNVDAKFNQGGFRSIWGPDSQGSYYIGTYKMSQNGKRYITGVKLVPKA